MATVTKSFTGSASANYYITITSNTTNINVTGATINVTSLYPTVTARITKSGVVNGYLGCNFDANILGVYASYDIDSSWSSGATKTMARVSSGASIDTSSVFTASNKTARSVSITYDSSIYGFCGGADGLWTDRLDFRSMGTINLSQTFTLNVPPTFSETLTYTGDFGGVPYANLTTANVTLSSLTAYYGGDFTGVGKAEFTIGSQTVSKANPANNDTLSIALNAVGTFTPTVKVTDSRGQITTHTLPAITVMGYSAPTVNFDAERTASNGAPNDEGTYAVISPKFTFTDAIATLSVPTVAVTDDEGVARTPTVTWYSTRAADGTLSGSVSWSSLSSGDTVYGLVSITNGFNTQKSYQISVTPQDSEGSGTAITQTLSSAFYTVDFLAGGHGIAFGEPIAESELFDSVGGTSAPTFATNTYYELTASGYDLLENEPSDWSTNWTDYYVKVHDGLFKCNMSATFKDDLLLDLPDYSTSDTTDKAIYDAVVALGWDSDVLVN